MPGLGLGGEGASHDPADVVGLESGLNVAIEAGVDVDGHRSVTGADGSGSESELWPFSKEAAELQPRHGEVVGPSGRVSQLGGAGGVVLGDAGGG